MRKAPVSIACAVSVVSVMSVLAFGQAKNPYPPAKPMVLATPATSAQRGEQLVMLGGCNDCHTPKFPDGRPDMSRMLSGHPENAPLAPEVQGGIGINMMLTSWRGPWGMTLTRNITPDKETGIGTWTVADFKRTLRTGVNPKGEIIMPPMPIAMYQNLPDQDLEAIFAYLRTIKPVRNAVGRVAAPPVKK